MQAADLVAVIHGRFSDYVTKELGVDPSAVAVVRNWTHLPPSEPVETSTAKRALGWPEDDTLAVHTGNMGAKQGLENIIEAARVADEKNAPARFVLVGDGGERKKLEQRAQGVKKLAFVDPLSDSDYRLALAAADVLIVNEKPGVAAMAVPSKLTSYFDAGRAVVAATDSDGITASEIKAADAGIVVRAGDPDALLDAVLELGADTEARLRFGRNGRQYREAVLDQTAAIERWSALIDVRSR